MGLRGLQSAFGVDDVSWDRKVHIFGAKEFSKQPLVANWESGVTSSLATTGTILPKTSPLSRDNKGPHIQYFGIRSFVLGTL